MPTFDNSLKSLFIDGKEVIRASLNGKVFYEKKMCELTLTADKPIIMTGETTVLTAGLTCNRVPVAGEKVKFYIVEDVPAGLSFTGDIFSVASRSSGLIGSDIVIDWGDGTTTNYTDVSDLNHTYSVSGDYFITITGVTSLGTGCFDSCTGLTSVVIPEGVTSLGQSCFYDCTGLTSVVIPEGVTSLGQSCFSNCTGLTSVVIPEGVTSLGQSCFSSCTGLTSVVIPEGVTSLGVGCFYDCTGLTSVVIPEGVTSLGQSCFSNCTGLTSVVIPDSVTSLGNGCFNHCTGLISLVCNWESNPPSYTANWISFASSSLKFSIPAGTTSVYTAAGYPSDKLEERSG